MHFIQLPPIIPIPDTIEQIALADSAKVKIATTIQEIAKDPDTFFNSLLHQGINFGLKVVAALAIYLIGAWLIGKIKRLLNKIFTARKTEKTLVSFVTSLVSVSLTILLIIIVIGALGVNTTSLAALLAAGGMAIGMAMSGTVQNFAGGIILLIFKPFKAGDFIEALGYAGIVKEINIFSTKLDTTDNKEVILPNGGLSNGNINNVTSNPLRRVDLSVSVEYGTDAEKCKEALLEIVKSNPVFLDATTPGAADPMSALAELADSSVNFIVRAWVKAGDYWTARFWLTETIYTRLPKDYSIAFPFPQLDVRLKKD